MHRLSDFSIVEFWQEVKWLLVVFVWPFAKFMWKWITGRTKRKLSVTGSLLERLDTQAKTIGDLTDRLTKLELNETNLLVKISHLEADNAKLKLQLKNK